MQIAQLIEENFGITGEVSQLPGERDLNYKITSAEHTYIFKVHDVAEQEFIALQQKILSFLKTTRSWTQYVGKAENGEAPPLPGMDSGSVHLHA